MSNPLIIFDAVFVLGLGAIFGSFLNVLLFRFNTGRGVNGRSACMRCGHTLGALDLVPILSYLFLRGRCRHCGTRISPQYPLVELSAALLSLGVYLLHPEPFLWALYFVLWMTILFIVVYDLRHTIIPWSASILLMILSLSTIFIPYVAPLALLPSQHAIFPLWAFLAGPLLALPLFLLSLVSGGRWMGWGDSPFELSLGWLLGISGGATALLLAVWSGALVGLVLIGLSRAVRFLAPSKRYSTHHSKKGFFQRLEGVTIKSEIPFAPFLAFGALIVFFFHVNFFTLPLFF